ncbi:hypothetical protein CRE_29524 [Caenorhabditis remanei]|uniref:Uncharacterized protein n=1 Tax=Caenorhabditis remanei TaxID=31234 RepID=E3LVH4_CAERE|nr:hypothetical protein CRE_29524 [Caenorhabditis remanei]
MVSSPAIHVTATLEDDVLSVTTSWTILRDNNCDVYRKQETTRSARGIAVDITISCTHRRVCGSVRGPGPAVPISCDVFNRNM